MAVYKIYFKESVEKDLKKIDKKTCKKLSPGLEGLPMIQDLQDAKN